MGGCKIVRPTPYREVKPHSARSDRANPSTDPTVGGATGALIKDTVEVRSSDGRKRTGRESGVCPTAPRDSFSCPDKDFQALALQVTPTTL